MRRVTSEPDNFIAQCKADSSLFEPGALRRRIEILDALDAIRISDIEQVRARRYLRAKLETANAAIYDSIRDQIRQGDHPSQLLHWIDRCSGNENSPRPGLGYDALDELISGVLEARDPDIAPLRL